MKIKCELNRTGLKFLCQVILLRDICQEECSRLDFLRPSCPDATLNSSAKTRYDQARNSRMQHITGKFHKIALAGMRLPGMIFEMVAQDSWNYETSFQTIVPMTHAALLRRSESFKIRMMFWPTCTATTNLLDLSSNNTIQWPQWWFGARWQWAEKLPHLSVKSSCRSCKCRHKTVTTQLSL